MPAGSPIEAGVAAIRIWAGLLTRASAVPGRLPGVASSGFSASTSALTVAGQWRILTAFPSPDRWMTVRRLQQLAPENIFIIKGSSWPDARFVNNRRGRGEPSWCERMGFPFAPAARILQRLLTLRIAVASSGVRPSSVRSVRSSAACVPIGPVPPAWLRLPVRGGPGTPARISCGIPG